MLLALASVVFLGSESFGTRDHLLLSQIWDVPFRRLLRLAGPRWRYSNPPPHGCALNDSLCLFITLWHGPYRKHSSSIVAWIRLCGNMFAQLFHRNGYTRHISYRDNSSVVACELYLATALSLAPQFLLWENTPHYNCPSCTYSTVIPNHDSVWVCSARILWL
jgi:hypothetical protein